MQNIVLQPASGLRPFKGNARTHSKRQVRQIADSIVRFGFTNPILVTTEGEVIAGHGRLEAAKLLGLEAVPTLCLPHLSPEERRAYVLADNKLALNAGWDEEMLAFEVGELVDLGFEVELTGFSTAEVDLLIARPGEENDPEDELTPLPGEPISRPGDLWHLGQHRLICGDARDAASYEALLERDRANLVFTDPPYNMAAAVRGAAHVKHRQFPMAAGELSEADYTEFLTLTLGHCAERSLDGAIAFVCMDWRHMGEMLAAGKAVFTQLKNVCVWDKGNGGMGKFYRSQHELVFVFKNGTAGHVNNFGMGGSGRYRTNVWDYPGLTGFREGRGEELSMHPTVKPVALVADAIMDCSHRGDLVLDAFAGSGTTLIAAQRCGRRARLIERDPAYCDMIIHRYEKESGQRARFGPSSFTFDQIRERRLDRSNAND